MLMPKELKSELIESKDDLLVPFPSSDSDVDSCINPPCSKLTVMADKRSSSLYSVSIASPRPELVRKLVISERFLMVAAPWPVFFNSSVNILYSFSDSRFVRRSLMYFAKVGVISRRSVIGFDWVVPGLASWERAALVRIQARLISCCFSMSCRVTLSLSRTEITNIFPNFGVTCSRSKVSPFL